MKRCSVSLGYKLKSPCDTTADWQECYNPKDSNVGAGRDVEKLNPCMLLVRMWKGVVTLENSLVVS